MSKNRNDKGRLTPFVPLLRETMATPAWRQLSHGAVRLYISLKTRVPKNHNVAWLSYRAAMRELGASDRTIRRWFAELVHYGFIVSPRLGSLGVEGNGKAPQWRLTELGTTRATSDTDEAEFGTNDYLRWDGVIFEPKRRINDPRYRGLKKQKPVVHGYDGVSSTGTTPVSSTGVAPKSQSVVHGYDIENGPNRRPR
ncbi:helix-turn-helix domain-containing protein [Methyloceanibacter sp.]|uniref:helix-turn-helix domain-containing protein n=1 Tax=Methyloceanibacter sp. TaxID=1965321 RepID=UPI00351B1535